MNDPNGTVFYNGYYHIFYQWNPHDDVWGNIHWGHARSRDLIAWEHLPAALTPSPELGEEHCFSGCVAFREKEPPLILYTAVGPQMDFTEHAQQWAAVGDDALVSWRKHPRNPILTSDIHGDILVLEWRDPFVFIDSGRTFLLLGGKLSEKDGGSAVVLLYEAKDGALEEWTYRGILYHHPDRTLRSLECPNFFKSGTEWMLLFSTHARVEYCIGDFDADSGVFTTRTSGIFDGSGNFIATNILLDESRRVVCFGWIRGFASNRGWNGCLSLPRIVTIDPAGSLRQSPAPEISMLHASGVHASGITLGRHMLQDFAGDAMDIHAQIVAERGGSFGLRLVPMDAMAETVTLTFAEDEARLNGVGVPYLYHGDAIVDIRLILDRSVVELFIDACVSVTLVLQPPGSSYGVELFSEQSAATVLTIDAWPLTHGVG